MTNELFTLLGLCAQAVAEDQARRKTLQAEADEENLLMVQTAAASRFGPEAEATFGDWHPVDDAPEETVQMFARLTDTVYLRYTAELDGALPWFDLVINCDACLSSRETRVSGGLVGLAVALAEAGLR